MLKVRRSETSPVALYFRLRTFFQSLYKGQNEEFYWKSITSIIASSVVYLVSLVSIKSKLCDNTTQVTYLENFSKAIGRPSDKSGEPI